MMKSYNNLINKMPADRQERIKQETKHLKAQMALAELRRALELTQVTDSEKITATNRKTISR